MSKGKITFLFIFLLVGSVYANNLFLNGAKVKTVIEMVAKTEGKNVLFPENTPNFEVSFDQNSDLSEEDVKRILVNTLAEHGYELIDKGNFFTIVQTRNSDSEIFDSEKNIGKDDLIYRLYSFKNISGLSAMKAARAIASKDAKIVYNSETNSLIIVDRLKKQEKLKKLFEKIDIAPNNITLKLQLKNQNPKIVAQKLRDIEKSSSKQGIGAKQAFSTVKFVPYENTNTLYIIGEKDLVMKYKNIALEIDRDKEVNNTVVEIVFLKNSDAKSMQSILKTLVSKKDKKKKTITKKTVRKKTPNSSTSTDFSNIVGDVSLSIDEALNAIILKGNKQSLESIKKLIEKLDIPKKQVYVKASILEIQQNDVDKIGTRYGLEGYSITDSGLFTLGANLAGQSVASNLLSNLLTSQAPDMTSLPAKGFAMGFTVDFLQRNGALQILSEPSVLCINNQEATIKVVETVPVLVSSTTANTGGLTNSYKREDVGITLKIKPRLTSGNKITLKVNAVMEGIVDQGAVVGTPTTTKREVSTTSILNNGEPVILGGLINTQESEVKDKVPLLGDIPLIGDILFTSTSTEVKQVNIIITLTPYIIDEKQTLEDLRKKLNFLQSLQKRYNEKMLQIIENKNTEEE